MSSRKIRVVVAKPGLDGHDRGAKIIARALRDAGMEVIYTGLHQTPEQIVETALQEDADAVGLSILSGAHMTLVPRIASLLKDEGAEDVILVVGGTIPNDDIPELKELGVAEVFTPGAPVQGIIDFIREAVPQPEAERIRVASGGGAAERLGGGARERVQLRQRGPERGVALGADRLGEAALDVGEDVGRRGERLGAVRGQSDDLGAPVRRIGHALDEAQPLEVSHRLAHRLLGQARALGQLRESRARVVDVGRTRSRAPARISAKPSAVSRACSSATTASLTVASRGTRAMSGLCVVGHS